MRLIKKILDATNFCKIDIRIQCLRAGGNAVIATDVDFNEIGAGSTNMLMVCMAGTAIRITDLSIFNKDKQALISEAVVSIEKLEAIARMPK